MQPMMQSTTTEQTIEAACREYLGERDPFLVGVELKKGNPGQLWVFLDSEYADVTIEQCSRISRELSEWLDREDVIDGGFRLNVSSPGLDRPLTDVRQYAKNIGRQCRVSTTENEKDVIYQGELTDVLEDAVLISVTSKKGRTMETKKILFSDIREIKIIPVFHS